MQVSQEKKNRANGVALAILLFMLPACSTSIANQPRSMLERLVKCDVSWDQVRNDAQVGADIQLFVTTELTRDPAKKVFVPNEENYLFGAKVLEFRTGFGMSPGYVVKLESSLAEVKQTIEAQGAVHWEECDSSSCARKVSETETFVLLSEGADLYAGCMYPFQR